MKLYRYLYYRLYSWNLRNWGREDLPQYNAMFGVSFLIYFNILTLAEIGYLLFDSFLPMLNTNVKLIILVAGLILIVINFFLFVKGRKFHKIIEEFKEETPKQKVKRNIIIWVYVILTFFIPIIIALLYFKYN